jgi:ketosteroid isomerase-like protein
MNTSLLGFVPLCCACLACASATAQNTIAADPQKEVIATERAFAKTMVEHDFAGFLSFVSEEAVFMQRDAALRGRDQIAAVWKPWYEAKQAPFSWEPERVEVLDSGTLAISIGPVRDENGKQIATFSSIWRRDAPGKWHIVFDKGNSICSCEH